MNIIKKFNPVILVEIQNDKAYLEIKETLSNYGYVNIDPGNKSVDRILVGAINTLYSFEEGSNNYVWVNPTNPVSWDFK